MKPADPQPDFRTFPFVELVKRDKRLADVRREYAGRSAEDRQSAAQWAYDESCVSDMFDFAIMSVGQEAPFRQRWPAGIVALAIDPNCAPALLTVGSMEHQLGRRRHAVELFQVLTTLPPETEDLVEIIDKAGAFLAREGDPEAGRSLYEAACSAFPDNRVLVAGLSYCLAKLNRFDEAIAAQRRAVALAPENSELLSDLGWVLCESGQYAEAEETLIEALRIDPENVQASNNLEEVRRRSANLVAANVSSL